jgi:hypothetical protein
MHRVTKANQAFGLARPQEPCPSIGAHELASIRPRSITRGKIGARHRRFDPWARDHADGWNVPSHARRRRVAELKSVAFSQVDAGGSAGFNPCVTGSNPVRPTWPFGARTTGGTRWVGSISSGLMT